MDLNYSDLVGDFSPDDDLTDIYDDKDNFNFKNTSIAYILKQINKLYNDFKHQKIFGKALIKFSN